MGEEAFLAGTLRGMDIVGTPPGVDGRTGLIIELFVQGQKNPYLIDTASGDR